MAVDDTTDPHSEAIDIGPTESNGDHKRNTKNGILLPTTSSLALPTLEDYINYIKLFYSLWPDAPQVPITYKDLTYTVKVPVDEISNPNVAKAFIDMFRRKRYNDFNVYTSLTGNIPAGRMTLVLGAPGSGKSQLLKTLGGHMRNNKMVKGELLYDGLSADEQLQAGIYTEKLCALVAQGDVHMANLTVRETLQFALDNSVVTPTSELFGGKPLDPRLMDYHRRKVDLLLSVLGLNECSNTITGNAMIRGVSGGQRKRTTIGELMISNARVLLLDEPTTGLDAAVSRDIMMILKNWCEVSGSTVISALLAPTPEVYELYQDLILLKDGNIVYHGPRAEIEEYMEQYWGLITPHDADIADFIIEVLTHPKEQFTKQQKLLNKGKIVRKYPLYPSKSHFQTIKQQPIVFHIDDNETDTIFLACSELGEIKAEEIFSIDSVPIRARNEKEWFISNDKLLTAYKESHYFQIQLDQVEQVFASRTEQGQYLDSIKEHRSAYTLAQYGQLYTKGLWGHTAAAMKRQFLLLARNKQTVPPRAFSAIFQAVIFGSLFYQLADNDFYSKLGILLFSLMFFAMGNFTELPATFEGRNAVYKQIDAGMFPTVSYSVAVSLAAIPVIVMESILYCVPLYFMVGLSADAGRIFFFLLFMILINLFFSNLFRTICYKVVSIDQAQQVAMPFMSIAMIYSGFLILKPQIKDWQIEFFWISPFSWAVRSIALNEFSDDKYDNIIQGDRAGNTYLRTFGIDTEQGFKWGGVAYMVCIIVLLTFVGSHWLKHVRFDLLQGTKRIPLAQTEQLRQIADNQQTSMDIKSTTIFVSNSSNNQCSFQSSAHFDSVIPFQPTSLSFENISYTITITNNDPHSKGPKNYQKKLLTNVNGYVKPYQLVALMGSSGAGKTTLMDVIAGRKTSGEIKGEIRFNGLSKKDNELIFRRITGYVEQQDIHMPLSTVRESLLFSARLRLPNTVTDEVRNQFVNELLDILELTHLADRIVGNDKYAGLSPGQLKLLTIGVELAANPSILFLDEPTSGLDSRAAVIVMRVIKRISQTGRAVLCTIHQPSSDVFFYFDTMLLLRTGGRSVFFGPIGEDGKDLVNYFESKLNEKGKFPVCPPTTNPATWMLDVIGAGLSGALERAGAAKHKGDANTNKVFDYAETYLESDLNKAEFIELQSVAHPKDPVEIKVNPADYKIPLCTQIQAVVKRAFISYWRDSQVNLGRIITLIVLCLIFGIVYYDLDENSYTGLTSKVSAVFAVAGFLAMLSAQITLPGLISERAIFYRERSCDAYPAWVYATTISVVEIIPVFVSSFFGVLIFYWLVGFQPDAKLFLQFYLAVSILVMIESAFGQLGAALFPNFVVAIQLLGVVNTLFFLFGGLFIQINKIPLGWKWWYYMNPIPKAIIAIVLPQFECRIPGVDPFDIHSGCPTITEPNTGTITIHAYIQTQWDISYENIFSRMMGWLVLTYCIFVIGIQLSLRYVNHMKR